MKKFATEYLVSNEVGRVHKMCGEVEAASALEARVIAEAKGHMFLGEIVYEEEAPGMADFCDRVQRERDEDWLEGQDSCGKRGGGGE